MNRLNQCMGEEGGQELVNYRYENGIKMMWDQAKGNNAGLPLACCVHAKIAAVSALTACEFGFPTQVLQKTSAFDNRFQRMTWSDWGPWSRASTS